MITIPVQTGLRCELVDIKPQLQGLIHKHGFTDGVLVVYCPHTTAGLTINEGADPDVKRDILATLERLIPDDGDYHHAEGNSDAHVKASLMGSSISIIIEDGKIQLGTWQTAYLCEFDGPRSRKIFATFLPSK